GDGATNEPPRPNMTGPFFIPTADRDFSRTAIRCSSRQAKFCRKDFELAHSLYSRTATLYDRRPGPTQPVSALAAPHGRGSLCERGGAAQARVAAHLRIGFQARHRGVMSGRDTLFGDLQEVDLNGGDLAGDPGEQALEFVTTADRRLVAAAGIGQFRIAVGDF